MPLTLESAEIFATRWYAAWNRGDLDAIMACYDDLIEHSSPFIARFTAGQGIAPEPILRGKAAVRAYFSRALSTNPTPRVATRFATMHLTVGTDSVLVVYRRWTGELAGEVFFLNNSGLITRSVSHYG